jgi:hypothetical protein
MQRNLNRGVLAALAIALTLAGAALAAKEVVRSGNLELTDNGGIAPYKLPARGGAPPTARLEAEVATLDGIQPPALQTVDLEVSKTIGIDAVGLPVCRMSQVAATSSGAAKRACADALIGSGSGSAEVETTFPEQAPFSSTGPLLLFNAGVRGKTTKVLLHAYSTSRRRPRSSSPPTSPASTKAPPASRSSPASPRSRAAPARSPSSS